MSKVFNLADFICIRPGDLSSTSDCYPGDEGTVWEWDSYGSHGRYKIKFTKENFGKMLYKCLDDPSYNPLPVRTITINANAMTEGIIQSVCPGADVSAIKISTPSKVAFDQCDRSSFLYYQNTVDPTPVTGSCEFTANACVEGTPGTLRLDWSLHLTFAEELDMSDSGFGGGWLRQDGPAALMDGTDLSDSDYIYVYYEVFIDATLGIEITEVDFDEEKCYAWEIEGLDGDLTVFIGQDGDSTYASDRFVTASDDCSIYPDTSYTANPTNFRLFDGIDWTSESIPVYRNISEPPMRGVTVTISDFS